MEQQVLSVVCEVQKDPVEPEVPHPPAWTALVLEPEDCRVLLMVAKTTCWRSSGLLAELVNSCSIASAEMQRQKGPNLPAISRTFYPIIGNIPEDDDALLSPGFSVFWQRVVLERIIGISFAVRECCRIQCFRN